MVNHIPRKPLALRTGKPTSYSNSAGPGRQPSQHGRGCHHRAVLACTLLVFCAQSIEVFCALCSKLENAICEWVGIGDVASMCWDGVSEDQKWSVRRWNKEKRSTSTERAGRPERRSNRSMSRSKLTAYEVSSRSGSNRRSSFVRP